MCLKFNSINNSNLETSFRETNDQIEYQEENSFANQISDPKSNPLSLNRVGNRKAIRNREDPLDVEPINLKGSSIEGMDSIDKESIQSKEIEDPW